MIIQLFPFRLLGGTVADREAQAAERARLRAALDQYARHGEASRKGWHGKRVRLAAERGGGMTDLLPADQPLDKTGGASCE